MSLDKAGVIDAVGISKADGAVVLTIVDGWDWRDERAHLSALQEKINDCLGFVETGQIYEDVPGSAGRPLRIEIVSRCAMPASGRTLVETANQVAAQLNVAVTQRCAG